MTTATPMAAEKFWALIAGEDPDAQMEALRTALVALTPDEIISFEVAFRDRLNAAYRWDLWGAAHVVHGGCSDDGFEYFRRWLVTRGRKVYEAALADPDSLADADVQPGPNGVWKFEEIYYVIGDSFEAAGGEGDVRDHSGDEAGLDGGNPLGEPFDDHEKQLSRRYPKLWRRFGDTPLG